jgi:hypothetical protein
MRGGKMATRHAGKTAVIDALRTKKVSFDRSLKGHDFL